MKERIESPSRENSPVSISKIKNPDAVINASEINNALPMSKLEYFFRIIAMISVPPLEEPMLKRIADPSAGRAMAKHNSSIGSSVKGECIGKSRSSTESETERRDAAVGGSCGEFFPEDEHSDDEQNHACDKVKVTCRNESGFSDKNGKTGNSAKSEIIRKFKKVCSECNKKRAECKHKEMF